MPCCAFHDRMDRVLSSEDYNDHVCGAPSNPRGERRFCCLQCPAQAQPLQIRGEWYDNPQLLKFLSPEQIATVFADARARDLLPRDGSAQPPEQPSTRPGALS